VGSHYNNGMLMYQQNPQALNTPMSRYPSLGPGGYPTAPYMPPQMSICTCAHAPAPQQMMRNPYGYGCSPMVSNYHNPTSSGHMGYQFGQYSAPYLYPGMMQQQMVQLQPEFENQGEQSQLNESSATSHRQSE